MGQMKNLISLDELSEEEIINIIETADKYSKGKKSEKFEDKTIANLFFEPSTRTQYSFEMAQHRLGIKTVSFSVNDSSVQKGETLYDTVKTFESIGIDGLVIRHPENNYYEELINNLNIPIFNGGDGSGNHPTQSLLDLLTIYQEYGRFEELRVGIIGDVAHSRVAHTNIAVMKRLGMKIHVIAPEEFREQGYEWENIDEIIPDLDIIMLLRVQHERHNIGMRLTKKEYHEQYGMTKERVSRMKDGGIIMHPAPFNRGVEIADEVVECENSRIFKQMENGVYVRMAVLSRAL